MCCYIFTSFTGSSSLLLTKRMDLLDIFDMTKKYERVMVPGSQTQGHVLTEREMLHDPFKIIKPVKGQGYAREYQAQEEHEMLEVSIMWYS